MATIKSYTDIEQSKKLAEILPLESADMHYPWYIEDDGDTIESGHRITTPNIGNFITHKVNKMILPCWSLAAVLNVLPEKYYPIKDHETNLILSKHKDKWCLLYWDATGMQDGEQTLADNPIDACVAMIEKLNELNLL